ncbi:YesL family protein [Bifidobacterium mongoliense]|uniref:YesL family protein n=1 Tax=Bifidobacterium mongoliense TaxID=518643 RepID=UPI0030EC5FC1
MQMLSPDSGFMRGLNGLVDGIWLNVLMLLTSIPIITIGATLAAGHDTARRTLRGEGHLTKTYMRSFRNNFLQSTTIWLCFGPTLVAITYTWATWRILPLLIAQFTVSILWAIGFEWAWALQARFSNPVGRTLINAFVFGISHAGTTLMLLIIDVAFAALLVCSWLYMPQGLFLLVILGYGSLLMLHVPLLERALAEYTTTGHSPTSPEGRR